MGFCTAANPTFASILLVASGVDTKLSLILTVEDWDGHRPKSAYGALSGHSDMSHFMSLSGVKRTCHVRCGMSAFDPKRTWLSRRKMFAIHPKQGFAALKSTYLLDGLLSRLMAQAVYRVAISAGMTKMETA